MTWTPDKAARARELLAAAAARPWHVEQVESGPCLGPTNLVFGPVERAGGERRQPIVACCGADGDAAFIAEAPDLLADALARIDQLEAALSVVAVPAVQEAREALAGKPPARRLATAVDVLRRHLAPEDR